MRSASTSRNAGELVAAYDVVIDGSDNFATKFLANDAAVLARRPLVHGAAVGMGGQLVTVPAGGRPCYRCLFEEPPPAGVGPSCAEAGVLGPVPGRHRRAGRASRPRGCSAGRLLLTSGASSSMIRRA